MGHGLAFLLKKPWHPARAQNMEEVRLFFFVLLFVVRVFGDCDAATSNDDAAPLLAAVRSL